jgi:hypothetical protein
MLYEAIRKLAIALLETRNLILLFYFSVHKNQKNEKQMPPTEQHYQKTQFMQWKSEKLGSML